MLCELVAGKAFPFVSVAPFRSLRLNEIRVLDRTVLVREAGQWEVRRGPSE